MKGNIGVTTENIFPVIKQFLYSDHEIFLRELVANAVDASQKMKALASSGDFKGELGELKVKIELDEQAKTLKIIDNGIGMTEERLAQVTKELSTDFDRAETTEKPSVYGLFNVNKRLYLYYNQQASLNIVSVLKGGETRRKNLLAVKSVLQSGSPTDLVAEELRAALSTIGTITGEITTPDILNNIFSRFCIGK